MAKVRVTIEYVSGKVVHSRYGYTQRVEQAVRFVEEEDLDEVVEQFRAHHDVVEVRIRRP